VSALDYTPFTISVEPHRNEVAVIPVGELDLATSPLVAEAVEGLRDAGFSEIVIDLRAIEFIDTQGLRMLGAVRSDTVRAGGSLTLTPPQPAARRIFEITEAHQLFEWRPSFDR
jgi:anti-sigma B factor antagonist